MTHLVTNGLIASLHTPPPFRECRPGILHTITLRKKQQQKTITSINIIINTFIFIFFFIFWGGGK